MVDSITIPQNLTKLMSVELVVKDTSDPLKRFLTDLLIRVQNLEKTVVDLQKQIDAL